MPTDEGLMILAEDGHIPSILSGMGMSITGLFGRSAIRVKREFWS